MDPKPNQRAKERPKAPLEEIRVIIRGNTMARSSKKARKTYLRIMQSVQISGRPLKATTINNPAIGVTEEDARRLHHLHDDALVISLSIADFNTRRVLVDNGSSTNILYYPAFQQIMVDKEHLLLSDTPLVGFSGTKVFPVGTITLPVTIEMYL